MPKTNFRLSLASCSRQAEQSLAPRSKNIMRAIPDYIRVNIGTLLVIVGYMLGSHYMDNGVLEEHIIPSHFTFSLYKVAKGFLGDVLLFSFIFILISIVTFSFMIFIKNKMTAYRSDFLDRQRFFGPLGEKLADQFQVDTPSFYTVRGRCVPFIIGFRRPVLILSSELCNVLSNIELEAIVAHEMHHIRRKDHLFRPVAITLLHTPFFNRLLRLWITDYLRYAEYECDRAASTLIGDPLVYAETLYKVAAWSSKHISSPFLCLLEQRLLPNPPDLYNRVLNILEPEHPANTIEKPEGSYFGRVFWLFIMQIMRIALVVEAGRWVLSLLQATIKG